MTLVVTIAEVWKSLSSAQWCSKVATRSMDQWSLLAKRTPSVQTGVE